jgi:dihydropteroate synthase
MAPEWGLERARGRAPLVMGILNVTPDSFHDGGRYDDPGRAEARALAMVESGADIIDIGGESTRPGAESVSVEEELRRVVPVLQRLEGRVSVPISIDTTKYEVARAALEHGARIVNDISACRRDPRMVELVRESGATVVLMHMKGTPRDMQRDPRYEDVVAEVTAFLSDRAAVLREAGVPATRIWLDPGIGFGKLLEHNLALLAAVQRLKALGHAVLVGPSRKSFISGALGVAPEERLWGSLAAFAVLAFQGLDVVRTHDVRETVHAVRLAAAIRAAGEGGVAG